MSRTKKTARWMRWYRKASKDPNWVDRRRRKDRIYHAAHKDEINARRRGRSYTEKSRFYMRDYSKKRRAKLRVEMLLAYGSACACCGESEQEFLTLDHINGGGRKHRADLNGDSIYAVAKREGWPKDQYQLLCMNCNWGRRKTGICPHNASRNAYFVRPVRQTVAAESQ